MNELEVSYGKAGSLDYEINEIRKIENMEEELQEILSITVGCSGFLTYVCC